MVDQQLLQYLQELLTPRRRAVFEKVLANRTRHFTVVLEDIYQKHNTSAVVRSCDIFGIQDLHIIENKYNSYVSNQVAKGSQKWIDFNNYDGLGNNTEICLETLREKGYQIIATSPHRDSCYLEDFDISKKSAFVFGVEKAGVSDYTMDQADGYLKIPMVGFTESLNVSVAAAIILESLTSRLRSSSINWELTAEEKNEKRLDWTKKTVLNVEEIIAHYYAKVNTIKR